MYRGGLVTRVFIIGAGAVGLLTASYLCEAGHAVTVIARQAEQAEAINKKGVTRYNIKGEQQTFNIKATTQLNIAKDSIVIIATKYSALQSIYPLLAAMSAEIPLLFLQNGLAHYEEVLQLPHEHITFGSAQFGAQKSGHATIFHRGEGVLKLAIARGDERVVTLFETLKNEAFYAKREQEAERMLLEKALLNCFINPLTALLEVKNGQLIRNEHALFLLKQLYKELMMAFPSMEGTFPFESVYDLCERTATNTSSMLSDRQQNKKSEVETIVGAVIKKARKLEKELPTLQILYKLLLAIEESGEEM